jgi:hypothetical protein
MRLLFERGFAPTHAFVQFYLWLRNTLQRRCGAAFRHAWRAGIHAGQTGGPWRARLAGPADRRDAEYLSLRVQQPVRGDLAKRRSGAVTVTHLTPPLALRGFTRACGAQGQPDALARNGPDAPERADLEAADRRTGRGGGHGRHPARRAVAEAAGNRGCADPRRAACGGQADVGCRTRRLSERDGRARCPAGARTRSRPCCSRNTNCRR